MKQIAFVLSFVSLMCAGEWTMFSDGKDTYIYSSSTGEIYIRHHLGKKNYEDVFVKMPRGMKPNELGNSGSRTSANSMTNSTDSERAKALQLDALKKSQELLNAAIE